jgi:acyl-CoA thioester hydrolase
MSRIKLKIPASFHFSVPLPIRITDINYGGHLGNDAILSLLHEARMQFLQQLGYTEMNLAGAALIMSDVAIEFKAEAFYGETVVAYLALGNVTKISIDIFYKLEKTADGKTKTVALAKTGMICFDYQQKKIAEWPAAVNTRFTALTELNGTPHNDLAL